MLGERSLLPLGIQLFWSGAGSGLLSANCPGVTPMQMTVVAPTALEFKSSAQCSVGSLLGVGVSGTVRGQVSVSTATEPGPGTGTGTGTGVEVELTLAAVATIFDLELRGNLSLAQVAPSAELVVQSGTLTGSGIISEMIRGLPAFDGSATLGKDSSGAVSASFAGTTSIFGASATVTMFAHPDGSLVWSLTVDGSGLEQLKQAVVNGLRGSASNWCTDCTLVLSIFDSIFDVAMLSLQSVELEFAHVIDASSSAAPTPSIKLAFQFTNALHGRRANLVDDIRNLVVPMSMDRPSDAELGSRPWPELAGLLSGRPAYGFPIMDTPESLAGVIAAADWRTISDALGGLPSIGDTFSGLGIGDVIRLKPGVEGGSCEAEDESIPLMPLFAAQACLNLGGGDECLNVEASVAPVFDLLWKHLARNVELPGLDQATSFVTSMLTMALPPSDG